MASAEHETPIALAKLDPELVAWLLGNLFHVKVPDYHHARTEATDIRVLVPRTYHADGVVVFCDPADRPLLAVVLEVQRGRDPAKRRTWKLYVAHLEAELDVVTTLLVFCPDGAVARWCRRLVEPDGSSLTLQPLILTPGEVPLVVDPDLARANPALAVLSVLCHGHRTEVDTVFPALLAALRSLGPQQALLYHDVVLAGLPETARVRWEAFVTTLAGYQYHSEQFRKIAAEAQQVGEARGEARAVLTVLEARDIPVSAQVRDQILACTDLARLDTWLRRATRVTAAEDVVDG